MAGFVVFMPMPHDAGQAMSSTTRRSTNEIRPAYMQGNTGMTIHIQPSITGDAVVDNYRPRTELGRKLIALRRAYVTTGGQLLDCDGLDAEIQLRRGGVVDA
jgi:hypothetical protein